VRLGWPGQMAGKAICSLASRSDIRQAQTTGTRAWSAGISGAEFVEWPVSVVWCLRWLGGVRRWRACCSGAEDSQNSNDRSKND